MSGTQDQAPTGGDQGRQRLAGREMPAKHSKFGGLWILLVLGAALLTLLLVFILMNTQRVLIHLYGAHFTAPLGVALLFAAVLGVLLVAVPGCARIIQLRRAAKRLHHEREHLAGRLDDVMGATDPADGSASGTAAAPAPAPQPQVEQQAPPQVQSGTAAPSQQQPQDQPTAEPQPKHHWWSSKR
jgi:uncharacterized integral membrane protein